MLAFRVLRIVPRRTMASQSSGTGSDLVKGPDGSSKEVDKQNGEFVNHNHHGAGYQHQENARDTYLNPLLTPPPRAPRTPEDFMNPQKIGHWTSLGFDYVDPASDKYKFHEILATFFFSATVALTVWYFAPDYKFREWSRREAFLRIHQREALGLPLIDKNVVDPERVVLPSEEELKDFPVHF